MAIAREVAAQEVENWLDKKKIKPSQRETGEAWIEMLTESIQDGTIVISEDGTITHKLNFPLTDKEGNVAVSELIYKPRLNDVMLRPYMVGVKETDINARIIAYMAALTGQLKALLEKLDTTDKRIAQAIVGFFF